MIYRTGDGSILESGRAGGLQNLYTSVRLRPAPPSSNFHPYNQIQASTHGDSARGIGPEGTKTQGIARIVPSRSKRGPRVGPSFSGAVQGGICTRVHMERAA